MTEPYAFLLRENGGPEILQAELIDVPSPEAGQVLVRHEAVGLNFIDTYHRSGLYKLPLPAGLGIEELRRQPEVLELRSHVLGGLGLALAATASPVDRLEADEVARDRGGLLEFARLLSARRHGFEAIRRHPGRMLSLSDDAPRFVGVSSTRRGIRPRRATGAQSQAAARNSSRVPTSVATSGSMTR